MRIFALSDACHECMPSVHLAHMKHLPVRLHIYTLHRCAEVKHILLGACKYSVVSSGHLMGDLGMHSHVQDLGSSTSNSCSIQQKHDMVYVST